MRSPLMTRRRVTAGLLAGTLLLAACGGGDESSDAGSGDALPQADATESDDAAADASTEAAPAPEGSARVDLVGPDVTAEADFEGNLLPDVVVDDLSAGIKVNFKNLVPQEKPILLWMYAPH